MIERFSGRKGHDLLVATLKRQLLFNHSNKAAKKIAKVSNVNEVQKGETIIQEGGLDNDIYFILSGRFSIEVNGREVAIREKEQHVGEMALIDSSARRSASVIALEESVVAKVSEPDFSKIANQYPFIWKNIAIEIANRLRQRNKRVEKRNLSPKVFIGCSVEALKYAETLSKGLEDSDIEIQIWNKNIFDASHFPIDDLLDKIRMIDFGILIIYPEDITRSRKKQQASPRDNIILELGLCMGLLGRERTFFVKPANLDVKIPSDLFGLTPVTYISEPDGEIATILAPACEEIKRIISSLGTR